MDNAHYQTLENKTSNRNVRYQKLHRNEEVIQGCNYKQNTYRLLTFRNKASSLGRWKDTLQAVNVERWLGSMSIDQNIVPRQVVFWRRASFSWAQFGSYQFTMIPACRSGAATLDISSRDVFRSARTRSCEARTKTETGHRGKTYLYVTSIGQRSSPRTCNSVTEINFLECKVRFPSAQLRQMHLFNERIWKYRG